MNILRTLVFTLVLLSMVASQALGAVVVLGTRGTRTDYAGLSTDTKPTVKAVAYGSTFYETDTLTLYVYTGEGWVVDSRPDPPKS